MCDFFEENGDNNKRKLEKRPLNKPNLLNNDLISINIDTTEGNSLKSESPSSFINPPSPTCFLQNFQFKSFPCIDYAINKHNQIKNKSLRFLKVTNDLINKINLLEEIYDGPEYKKPKLCNKLIECRLDELAAHKVLSNLVSKLTNDDYSLCDRTIHPAYSSEEQQQEFPEAHEIREDEEQLMDSSGIFKIPSTPILFTDETNIEPESIPEYTEPSSLFLEHEGSTYIRVDDTNYHLVRTVNQQDGTVVTETGLHISVPDGTEVPVTAAMVANMNLRRQKAPPRPSYGSLALNQHSLVNQQPQPYADYVALPMRPPPLVPFTLSSQLYTPELSISLTETESELMLTIDCVKRAQPQQPPVHYQIHGYRDPCEDRRGRPGSTPSAHWALVGEVRACPLPMFCTVSVPPGCHRHYFAIRSVDELSRFSDWSNVVQVEVAGGR